MKDFIFIAGAPGSGKTTIAELLQKKLNSLLIDFGRLREFHLDRTWSNQSEQEEQMAFENLIFILKNYHKNGFKNVLVTDLNESKLMKIAEELGEYQYSILTLTLADDEELKKRVQGVRDSGFKDVGRAIEWNKSILDRGLFPNEQRIDNAHNEPEKTVEEIVGRLQLEARV